MRLKVSENKIMEGDIIVTFNSPPSRVNACERGRQSFTWYMTVRLLQWKGNRRRNLAMAALAQMTAEQT